MKYLAKYMSVTLIVLAAFAARFFSVKWGLPEEQQNWWGGVAIAVMVGATIWFLAHTALESEE